MVMFWKKKAAAFEKSLIRQTAKSVSVAIKIYGGQFN